MSVTVEDVLALKRPTDGFLCPLSANKYGIEFLNFTISDYETKKVIFEVGRDSPTPADISIDFSSLGEDLYRKIKYNFSEDVLKLPQIQTSLVFSTGQEPLQGFRMIERHYFKDRLIKSFDFPFGFCIPGSTNTWDAVYSMPPMDSELLTDIVNNPYETKSDSFYFVDGKLVMHNKASYKYFREDSAQAKKSYEDKFGAKGAKPAAKVVAAAKDTGAPRITLEGTDHGHPAADSKDGPRSRSGSTAAPLSAGAKGSKQEWSKETDYI